MVSPVVYRNRKNRRLRPSDEISRGCEPNRHAQSPTAIDTVGKSRAANEHFSEVNGSAYRVSSPHDTGQVNVLRFSVFRR
jgi:hypothetical protein